MSDANVNDKIASIHDQTLSTLRALGLPPLPHHYKKYFDEIVRLSEDNELIALQNENLASNEELKRYLDIAHRSIEAFVETHADISHVAQLQENYISKAPKEGIERCVQQGALKNVNNAIYRYISPPSTYADDYPIEGRTFWIRAGWKF